jgi:hypothetical protein
MMDDADWISGALTEPIEHHAIRAEGYGISRILSLNEQKYQM